MNKKPQHTCGADLKEHRLRLLTLNHGLVCWARLDRERPVLNVCLDAGVRKLPANEPLGIEDSVGGVHGHLHTKTG